MTTVTLSHRLTPPHVFAAVQAFEDAIIEASENSLRQAVLTLAAMKPLDAVRLVLATTQRCTSVSGQRELEGLADYLGVYEEEAETELAE